MGHALGGDFYAVLRDSAGSLQCLQPHGGGQVDYTVTGTITRVAIEVLKIAASGVIFFFIGFEIFDVQSFESAVDG